MAGIYNFTDGLKLLSTGFIQGDKFDLIKVEHLEQSLKFLENFRNRRGVSEARANLFIIILDKHYLDEYLNLESRNFKKTANILSFSLTHVHTKLSFSLQHMMKLF